MGTELTPKEKKAIFEIAGRKNIPAAEPSMPAPELSVSLGRLIDLYAAVLRGEPKPDDLTAAEESLWDSMAAEVAAAPPDTPWRIPG